MSGRRVLVIVQRVSYVEIEAPEGFDIDTADESTMQALAAQALADTTPPAVAVDVHDGDRERNVIDY